MVQDRIEIRILLVEDDEWLQMSLGEFFEKKGYHISVAGTAEKALTILRDKEFDVIIIDNILPGMNGMSLLQQLDRSGSSAVKIFISGHSIDETMDLALTNGADRCLFKPFNVETLEKNISDLISVRNN